MHHNVFRMAFHELFGSVFPICSTADIKENIFQERRMDHKLRISRVSSEVTRAEKDKEIRLHN